MYNWTNNQQQNNQNQQNNQSNNTFGFNTSQFESNTNPNKPPLQLGFNPAQNTNMFGGSTGGFGSNQNTFGGNSGGFGRNTSTFGSSGTTNSFNNPSNTTTFGNKPTTFGSTFCNQNNSYSSATSTFGNQQRPSGFGSNFGSSFVSKPAVPTNQFGQSTSTQTTPFNGSRGFSFSQSSNTQTSPFSSSGASGFNNQPTTQFSQNQYGSSATTSQPFGSGGFGSTFNTGSSAQAKPFSFATQTSSTPTWNTTNTWSAGGNKGTQAATYTPTLTKGKDGNYSLIDATGMLCYKEKSNDELRKEDYQLDRKNKSSLGLGSTGNTTSFLLGTTATSPFGTAVGSNTTTNPFGNTTTPSGPSNPFGSVTAAQPLTNPFGTLSAGTTQPSNPFGSATQSSSNPFGTAVATTTPSTNPFGTTATQPSQSSSPFNFSNPFTSNATTLPTSATNAPGTVNANSFSNLTAGFTNNQTYGTQPINLEDPYLISNLEFPKPIPTKPTVKINLPKPIFSQAKLTDEIEIKIRPPKKYLSKNIYTIPEDVDENRVVNRLIVGIENKGKIEYLEPVQFNRRGLEDIIINGTDVVINDAIGTGYNKRAKVYIEGVYAYSRTTGSYIRGKQESWPNKGLQERFIHRLKSDINKNFIDYDPETGLYIYEVDHF